MRVRGGWFEVGGWTTRFVVAGVSQATVLPVQLRKGRDTYVYGQTSSGRYLFVVYLYLGKRVSRVVTARDMTKRERNLYIKR
ncbi:MAG: hypothetical protein GIS02_00120 [Methanosarcinales archaeon]|uniref:BrnT family toxin n=1 Tax=Candidatus Ethanoperedens thermophilum TaxID=2766897 RepID=A0A848D8Y2_9EURY|nr:hypothetical protein [Candidatus Ethanoperedens thermophilum]